MAGGYMSKKEKVFIYLCFVVRMLVDWIKGSQKWELWGSAVNCGGWLLLAMAAGRIQWKKKDIWLAGIEIVLGTVFFFLTQRLWMTYYGVVFSSIYWSGVVNVIGIGILGCKLVSSKSWKDESGKGRCPIIRLKRKNLVPVVGILLMVLLMTLSPLRSLWPLWYGAMAAIFLSLPPTGEEEDWFWRAITGGSILVFFLIQTYAYGFRPYDEVRYKGAYGNANINALFYLFVLAMVLCRLYMTGEVVKSDKSGTGRKVVDWWSRVLYPLFYLVLGSGLLVFILFTLGRTAILIGNVLILTYGILGILVGKRKRGGRAVGYWLVTGGLALLLFLPVYGSIRYLPTVLHHPIWYEGEYSEQKVHSFDPPNSHKYISLDEFLQEAKTRLGLNRVLTTHAAEVGWEKEQGEGREDAGLKDAELEDVGEENVRPETSGAIRKEILRLYLRDLNWTGHRLEDGYYPINEHYHAWHAQNVFLQFAYYYGIPAGILFLLLTLWKGFRALRDFVVERSKESLLRVMVWLIFVGYGMMEAVWYPGQTILLMACMADVWLRAGTEYPPFLAQPPIGEEGT